jgi:hypothetical protein
MASVKEVCFRMSRLHLVNKILRLPGPKWRDTFVGGEYDAGHSAN